MAEYYVIKDKNTGLYFRGKGVNRWGKQYNQASIYRVRGMAENTVKEVSWRGEQAEIVPIQIVETTADVVPKSEVEKEVVEYIEKHLQYQRKKVDLPFTSRDMRNYQCGAIDVIEYFEELIAELKNKYAEGGGNG